MHAALRDSLRTLGFVALHAAMVGVYLTALSELLPALRDEGGAIVVFPATALAAAALAVMHPFVRAARTHPARFAILVGFTAIAMLGYAVLFAFALTRAPNPIGLAALVVAAELIFGAPLFIAVAVSAKLTSRCLVGRPATW